MKIGQRVTVKNLDFMDSEDSLKRPKSLIGKEGTISDVYLGVFKVDVDGKIISFDGRELQLDEHVTVVKAEWVFVSWQKNGKSVYNTKEGDPLFIGDFHHGTGFKGEIELTDEEIFRINEAAKKGIAPVFDLRIEKGEKRSNRR